MVDVGDLVLRKDSGLAVDAAADATALGTEVFQALQLTATEAWGEGSSEAPWRPKGSPT